MNKIEIMDTVKDSQYEKYLDMCAKESAVIEYSCKPEVGTHIKLQGIGPLLFGGVCEILKEIATHEGEDTEIRKLYVQFVCDWVLRELDEEVTHIEQA